MQDGRTGWRLASNAAAQKIDYKDGLAL